MPQSPTNHLPAQPNSGGTSTFRMVTTVLFCVLAVVFFDRTPAAARWPVRALWVVTAGWLVLMLARWLRGLKFDAKKAVFTLIIGVFFYGTLMLVCHVFIRLMSLKDDRLTSRSFTTLSEPCRTGIRDMLDGKSYNLFDKTVGWVPRPEFHSDLYTISAQGLRGAREYPLTPPDPAKRFLCMGDSFTFGYGVTDDGTYPHHAEQLLPGTEWLNFGISGTCLTQSLLHYRQTAKKFGGKHVIIGFMTNDAPRTVNCFRPFVSPFDAGHPFTKPFAQFSGGKFSIEPNPYQEVKAFDLLLANEPLEIAKLRRIDYLTWSNRRVTTNPILRTADYVFESLNLDRNIDLMLARKPSKKKAKKQPTTSDPYGRAIWSPDGNGYQAIVRMMDLYHDEVVADGREPLIVLIPGPLDIEDYEKKNPRQYAPLIEHLKAKGWLYLDFLDPLMAKHSPDEKLFTQLHYTGPVNRELAEAIIKASKFP